MNTYHLTISYDAMQAVKVALENLAFSPWGESLKETVLQCFLGYNYDKKKRAQVTRLSQNSFQIYVEYGDVKKQIQKMLKIDGVRILNVHVSYSEVEF